MSQIKEIAAYWGTRAQGYSERCKIDLIEDTKFDWLDPDISHVLRGFYFDKVFITVDGIDLERGYTVNNKNQIGLYTQLARMTRRFYILADSAKYDRRAFASVFPPEKTCRMITTSGAPQKYLDFYARQGIPCTVLPFE